MVAEGGKSLIPSVEVLTPNNFNCKLKKEQSFVVTGKGTKRVRVIQAIDGEILTRLVIREIQDKNGCFMADPSRDLLKIAVINRYSSDVAPAIGFIEGFGMSRGAIASSVSHDSHNIVVIGTKMSCSFLFILSCRMR